MLNIPSTVEDTNYRYRMPKMQLKIESKGNGIKTNIVNLSDVAKYLRTDPQYILKYFGFERASQTTFKEAGGKNNTNYIINGDFTYDELLKTLDKFIEKYICCPKCKLPEMHLVLINNLVTGKCDSCPFNGELDNKHRLTAFIQKNPPVTKSQATGKKQKHEPKVKVETTTTKKKDKKEEVKEKQAKDLFDTNNLEFGSEELENLIEYMREYIDKRKDDDFDIMAAYIVQELKSLKLKKSLLAYVIFNSIFNINIANQIKSGARLYAHLMSKLVAQNLELETLLNLEYLFLEKNKDESLTKFLPTIMMKMFEAQILSDTFIKNWGSEKGMKECQTAYMYNEERDQKFKEIVADFIEWATEDMESDEEQQEEQEDSKNTQNGSNNEQAKQEEKSEQPAQSEPTQEEIQASS